MRLGIDIQGKYIFAALIKRRGKHWDLIRLVKKVGDFALQELRKDLPRFGLKTIVGIPRKNILLKEITLDRNLQSQEIAVYLEKNISKLFGDEDKKLYFDFEENFSASKPNQIRIIAVEKIWLDQFLEPLKKARFKLLAADVDELAKTRGHDFRGLLPDTEFINALGLALWTPSNEH